VINGKRFEVDAMLKGSIITGAVALETQEADFVAMFCIYANYLSKYIKRPLNG
jgi:hypothetical protein